MSSMNITPQPAAAPKGPPALHLLFPASKINPTPAPPAPIIGTPITPTPKNMFGRDIMADFGALSSTSANPPKTSPTVEPSTSPNNNEHKCFDTSPTIYEFSKREDTTVLCVNLHKTPYVDIKHAKLKCMDCSSKQEINDKAVHFICAFYGVGDGKFFAIKLKNREDELYYMEANLFRCICPSRYQEFVTDSKNMVETLTDLATLIAEEKKEVKKAYQPGGCLEAFNDDDDPPIDYNSEPVMNVMRQITKLFLWEMQFAMGEFMLHCVDCAELHRFVEKFWENRPPHYAVVKKKATENFEAIYVSLLSKETVIADEE